MSDLTDYCCGKPKIKFCRLSFTITAIGLILSFVDVILGINEYWRGEALVHGAAHYDQTTGEWKWNL